MLFRCIDKIFHVIMTMTMQIRRWWAATVLVINGKHYVNGHGFTTLFLKLVLHVRLSTGVSVVDGNFAQLNILCTDNMTNVEIRKEGL